MATVGIVLSGTSSVTETLAMTRTWSPDHRATGVHPFRAVAPVGSCSEHLP